MYPHAYVYRFPQLKRKGQDFDLAVIKQEGSFFIECKNRNVKGAHTKTLDTLFDPPDPEEGKLGQLERQENIVKRTGLDAYLFFEMSRGRGISKEAVLVDLLSVRGHRMDLEEPEIGTVVPREGEKYILEKSYF